MSKGQNDTTSTAAAAVFTNALCVPTAAAAVGVGVTVLEGEKRATACSGTPKAAKQSAVAAVRAKTRRKRKIERKSQRRDLSARKLSLIHI